MEQTVLQRPEILAPAGNADMLRAAVFAGADAVYLGLDGYNARRSAGNFDPDALREAVCFCHARGVAVHVTLNTLVYAAELGGLAVITFTAGIGENDWSIRKAFCDCFEWLGVRIDNNKNREAVGNGPQVISAAGSAVTVMVIPTDEEYMIAHDVERLTKNN